MRTWALWGLVGVGALLMVGAAFLWSWSFWSLASIDTTLPPLELRGLRVAITAEGYEVVGEELGEPRVVLPCTELGCPLRESYDREGLRAHLLQVHERHPDLRELVLVPAPDVTYEVLIDVMDTARTDPHGDDLFPYVVIGGPPR